MYQHRGIAQGDGALLLFANDVIGVIIYMGM